MNLRIEDVFSAAFSHDLPCSSRLLNFLTENFLNEFNRISNANVSQGLSFAKKYVDRFPLNREVLGEIYVFFLHEVGSASCCREIVKIYVEATEKLTKSGQSTYGIPPILDKTYMLRRIGEMVDQTMLTHFAMQLGFLSTKPILILPNRDFMVNTAFHPYLEDAFDIVSDGQQCAYFTQLAPFIPYTSNWMKISENLAGPICDIGTTLFRLLESRGLSPYPFKLKGQTADIAEKFLKKYELNSEDKFVVLHLREKGYIDALHHELRNIHVPDFIPAIDWLLNQGIKVIRIGHKKMTKLPEKVGLIDLTSVDRPGEVDIFLTAKALFYYGNPSGPQSLSLGFGTPILATHLFPYTHIRQNQLHQIQPIKNERTGKILTINELSKADFRTASSPKVLKRHGLRLQRICIDQHLNSVKEMMDFLSMGKIFKLNHHYDEKKKLANIESDIYFTSSSLELL